MEQTTPKPRGGVIKNIYLYLVSFVALMMLIFSVANMIDIALRTYLFPKADDFYSYYEPICTPTDRTASTTTGTPVKGDPNCISKEEQDKRNKEQREQQRQRDLVRDISMILVAAPIFAYHWMIIRSKEENA